MQNANAPESMEIAREYMRVRGVPATNLVTLRVSTAEELPLPVYETGVRDVVATHINKAGLKINFLLLIRGVPIRIDNENGPSLDAFLMVDAHPNRKDKPLAPMKNPVIEGGNVRITPDELQKVFSPYAGKRQAFDSNKYGFYLATRLDGYTKQDALDLISRSAAAAPAKGRFLLDASPKKAGAGFGAAQSVMKPASALLRKKGYHVTFDESDAFIGNQSGLMGYASWGSNDPNYDQARYHSLRFLPGSIAETFVSTSARTFRQTAGGQSLVADLVRQGVTGVKGYVSEPFTFALARVDILFDRYTDGFNLAESFWMATPLLKWKDVVIGDPLCAPYARTK